ncbi:MAG: hypothetical protein LBP78_01490 [Acidaminococcales bacterium]|nr:hypothetical protein [Acidaminococcales bacterium]
MKKQRIGTNELIVVHGDITAPEAVFYVREFKGGEIRNVAEAKPAKGGWAADLEDGKQKVFTQKWLETVFME